LGIFLPLFCEHIAYAFDFHLFSFFNAHDFQIWSFGGVTGFFLFFFFYYSYMHTRLGSFLPTASATSLTTHSTLSLYPPLPQYPAETILPLFLILL
jgi:hypothetical protein